MALASGTPNADLVWLHTGWTFKTVTFLMHYSKKTMIFFSKPRFFGLFINKLVRGGIDPGRTKILKTNNDETNCVKMTEILHSLVLIENFINTGTLTQRKRGVYKFKIKVMYFYM